MRRLSGLVARASVLGAMAAPLLGTAVAYAATTPTNVVTNSTPTTLGKVVTLTAKVTGPSGAATPTGTLTWTLTGPVTTCASTTGPTGASKRGHLHLCDHRVHDRHLQRHSGLRR